MTYDNHVLSGQHGNTCRMDEHERPKEKTRSRLHVCMFVGLCKESSNLTLSKAGNNPFS